MYIAVKVFDREAEVIEVFTDLRDAVLYANIQLNTYRQRYNLKENTVDGMWGEADESTRCAFCNTDDHDFDVHILDI